MARQVFTFVFVVSAVHVSSAIPVSTRSSLQSCNKTYTSADGKTCCYCSAGYYRVGDCIDNLEQARCAPCSSGTFQPTCTMATSCAPCSPNCKDRRLVMSVTCARVSDIVCTCMEGHFWQAESSNKADGVCKEHSQCKQGFGLKYKGDAYTDTECEPCRTGATFSSSRSFESCKLCAACKYYNTTCTTVSDATCSTRSPEETGKSDHEEGNGSEKDAGLHMPIYVLNIAFAVGCFAAVVFVTIRAIHCVRRKRRCGKPTSELEASSANHVEGSDLTNAQSGEKVNDPLLPDRASTQSGETVNDPLLPDRTTAQSGETVNDPLLPDRTTAQSGETVNDPLLPDRTTAQSGETVNDPLLPDRTTAQSGETVNDPLLPDRTTTQSGETVNDPLLSDRATAQSGKTENDSLSSDRATAQSGETEDDSFLSDRATAQSGETENDSLLSDRATTQSGETEDDSFLSDQATAQSGETENDSLLSDRATAQFGETENDSLSSDRATAQSGETEDDSFLSDRATAQSGETENDSLLSDRATTQSGERSQFVEAGDDSGCESGIAGVGDIEMNIVKKDSPPARTASEVGGQGHQNRCIEESHRGTCPIDQEDKRLHSIHMVEGCNRLNGDINTDQSNGGVNDNPREITLPDNNVDHQSDLPVSRNRDSDAESHVEAPAVADLPESRGRRVLAPDSLSLTETHVVSSDVRSARNHQRGPHVSPTNVWLQPFTFLAQKSPKDFTPFYRYLADNKDVDNWIERAKLDYNGNCEETQYQLMLTLYKRVPNISHDHIIGALKDVKLHQIAQDYQSMFVICRSTNV